MRMRIEAAFCYASLFSRFSLEEHRFFRIAFTAKLTERSVVLSDYIVHLLRRVSIL